MLKRGERTKPYCGGRVQPDFGNGRRLPMSKQNQRRMSGFLGECPIDPVDRRHLLLKAGDIETNPGPYPCGACNRNVTNRDYSILCRDCRLWFHRKCVRMTIKEILDHDNWSWHCGCTPVATKEFVKQKQPMNELRILQLNICGLRSKCTILMKLIEECQADIVLLQETKLTEKDDLPSALKSWTPYRRDRKIHTSGTTQPQGGVLTLVRPGLGSEPIKDLDLPNSAALENVGTRILRDGRSQDIWNLYRPPTRTSDGRDGSLYSSRWPKNAGVIAGDFNAHGFWETTNEADPNGDEIEEWLVSAKWMALNNGQSTRISGASETAPDLTLIPSHSAAFADWSVLETIGSDHLPLLTVLHPTKCHRKKQKRHHNFLKLDIGSYQKKIQELLEEVSTQSDPSLEHEIKIFSGLLLEAAKCSSPLTSNRKKKMWWSKECQKARTDCRKAFRAMRNQPSESNRLEYQHMRDKMQKTITNSKSLAWKEFVSELNPRTPTSKVWSTLRSLDGRSKTGLPDVPITQGGKKATTDLEKATLAVKTYASVSRVKIPREVSKAAYCKVRAALKRPKSSEMDRHFSIAEMREALRETKLKSPGEDRIHPILLKSLPEEGLSILLGILNRSWTEGRVPAVWRQALIIPVLKKKKPASEIKSYRPVSLLSAIAKLAEKMVFNRLLNWALKEGHIPDQQSGFRPGRSTVDALTSIAQRAFNNLQKKLRTLLVAIDLKAAFDRVW